MNCQQFEEEESNLQRAPPKSHVYQHVLHTWHIPFVPWKLIFGKQVVLEPYTPHNGFFCSTQKKCGEIKWKLCQKPHDNLPL